MSPSDPARAASSAEAQVDAVRLTPGAIGLAVVSALLLVAAQPPWSLAPLAWVALVPLLLALRERRASQRLWLGLLCGTVWAWGLVGYWLFPAAAAALPVGRGAAVALALAAVELCGGFYVVAFALLHRPSASALGPLRGAALWVGLDLLRAKLFGGMPWGYLGHALWEQPLLIQATDLAGVYGVSFVIAAVNIGLAQLVARWRSWGRADLATALVTALLPAALCGYGALCLRGAAGDALAGDHRAIQVVRSAWDDDGPGAADRLLAHLVELTERVEPDGADVVVWPEGSLRFYWQDAAERRAVVLDLAARRGQFLVAGGPRHKRTFAGRWFFNSALLLGPHGALLGQHNKRILVPLVERKLRALPSVARPFRRGRGWKPLRAGERQLGVVICFEAIFPSAARTLVAHGAEVLVNISNDQLLGAGAEQLAAMAVFRAVETRVPLVRVSNLGPTLLADSYGRITQRWDVGEGSAVWPLPAALGGSWYLRWGDVFALVCAAFACADWLAAAGAQPRTIVRGQ